MPTPIFHLYLKDNTTTFTDQGTHHYYRTLSALFEDKGALIDVSLSTLQKYDFSKNYFNAKCIIIKATMYNSKDIKTTRKAMRKSMSRKS